MSTLMAQPVYEPIFIPKPDNSDSGRDIVVLIVGRLYIFDLRATASHKCSNSSLVNTLDF